MIGFCGMCISNDWTKLSGWSILIYFGPTLIYWSKLFQYPYNIFHPAISPLSLLSHINRIMIYAISIDRLSNSLSYTHIHIYPKERLPQQQRVHKLRGSHWAENKSSQTQSLSANPLHIQYTHAHTRRSNPSLIYTPGRGAARYLPRCFYTDAYTHTHQVSKQVFCPPDGDDVTRGGRLERLNDLYIYTHICTRAGRTVYICIAICSERRHAAERSIFRFPAGSAANELIHTHARAVCEVDARCSRKLVCLLLHCSSSWAVYIGSREISAYTRGRWDMTFFFSRYRVDAIRFWCVWMCILFRAGDFLVSFIMYGSKV